MPKLTFYKPPEIQKGYILNQKKSFFSVIVPEETTNLIYNPETAHLSDFDTANETQALMQDRDVVLFGEQSISSEMENGEYIRYSVIPTLIEGTRYTASVYVLGTGQYRLAYYDSHNDVTIATGAIFHADPNIWTRQILTFVVPEDQEMLTSEFRIINAGSASKLWISGLQLEQKPYATTFCSGNLTGLLGGELPKPYFWMATPNYSPSMRLATTRDGGKVVSLEKLGFHVTGFSGLGTPEFETIATPVANGMGSVYQGSTITDRDIEICGVLTAATPKDFFCGRGLMGHSVQPSLSGKAQPLKLLYSVYEGIRQVCHQTEIYAVYESGLEGDIQSLLGEEICISFKMLDPLVKRIGNNAMTLNVFKQVIDQRSPVGTDANGEWQPMGDITELFGNAGVGGDMAIGPDNNLYIGGPSNAGAGYHLMARWNGVDWESIGISYAADGVTPVAGTNIGVIIPGPDNTLYVGGHFHAIGNENGVVSVTDGNGSETAQSYSRLNIARYRIATNEWEYIGRFLGESGKTNVVEDMVLLQNNKIMIVGNFREPQGTNQTVFAARNIITFVPATNLMEYAVPNGSNNLGATDDSIIYSIDQAPNGHIWIGGDFEFEGNLDYLGGHLTIENVAVMGRWVTNDNEVLGFEGASGVLPNANVIGGPVSVVKVAPDGTVWIGGSFTASQIYADINVATYPPHVQVSDTSVQNQSAAFGIARLSVGAQPNWYSEFIIGGIGFDDIESERYGTVSDIEFDQDGNMHFVGQFNFCHTYFPNLDYEEEPAEAGSDWSVTQALTTQTPNCNGYMIWTGESLITPDILFSDETTFGDEGNPRTISNITLGTLNAHRYSEHSSAPIPNSYQYQLPGTGGANINPGFSGSVFLIPDVTFDSYDFISKEINFVELGCNDYSKPVFIINGPGKLKSIINETIGTKIFFDYDMAEGETIVLDLTQPLFKLISNLKGNLRGIIKPNSNLSSFVLTSGRMGISVNMDLLTIDPEEMRTSLMKWRTQYWNVDLACDCDCGSLGSYG